MELNGELTDEQKIILDTFREYCRRKIDTNYGKWLKSRVFPKWLMKDLASMFLPSIVGLDGSERMDEVTLGLISEEMGRWEFPVPAFLSVHFSKILPLVTNPEARTEFLMKFVSGDLLISGAFSEPGCGSDSGSIITTAKRKGTHYAINGEKSFISGSGISDAMIVSAQTGENVRGHGISLFLVNAGSEGIERYELTSMASMFDGDFGGIRFNEVTVPEGNLIGSENRGFNLLMHALNSQRGHVALYSLGLAERSLQDAVEHAKDRKAFGHPISKQEAVSFRLAEDWTRIEAAKLLAYKALAMTDRGLENSAECAGVKWFGCETSFDAVSHALQTFGASGYVTLSPIERRFRTARGFLIGDGTPDIQKLIISRKLFGREFAP
ncbi:MAG: acyl-CoA dehydrogenase family protein [Thermoplasmataceae archaeon]